MKLFHVQDPDRPMYMFASTWREAFNNWCAKIAEENDCSREEVEDPDGIAIVADEDDILPPGTVDDYEKEARVYYQNIVYEVCGILDDLDGRRVSYGEGIVCGTVSSPSTEVQDRLKHLAGQLKHYQELVDGTSTQERKDIKAKVYYTESARARDELADQYRYAAVIDVVAERTKQRLKWSEEHDDGHGDRQLAENAGRIAYRYAREGFAEIYGDEWSIERNHPDPRERLVIAAALLIAEIERLDRLEAQPKCPEEPPREILGKTFTIGPGRTIIDSIKLDTTGLHKWWVKSGETGYEWNYFWNQIPPEERDVIPCS